MHHCCVRVVLRTPLMKRIRIHAWRRFCYFQRAEPQRCAALRAVSDEIGTKGTDVEGNNCHAFILDMPGVKGLNVHPRMATVPPLADSHIKKRNTI